MIGACSSGVVCHRVTVAGRRGPLGEGGRGPPGEGGRGALGKRGGGGEVVVNMLREERSGLSSRCQTFQICDQQRV